MSASDPKQTCPSMMWTGIRRYWNVTAAMARFTLSCGQRVIGPGGAPGLAILVPWPGRLRICAPAAFDTRTTPSKGTRRGPDRRSARPKIVPRMPIVATGVVTFTSERASFNPGRRNRKKPTSRNLIFPRPAAGLKTYLSSVNFAFSPSVSRVLSLKVTSSRPPTRSTRTR